MSSNRSNWKGVERKVAGLLSQHEECERVPVSGRTGKKGMESPDIASDRYAIEIKSRAPARPGGSAIIPKWLGAALKQANASRQSGHMAAIVILHETGKRHDNDLVLMSLKDFRQLDWFLDWFTGPDDLK